MADRRMFAKTIVLSDAFLDMPMSTRNLYFTLGMVADDDGFVNNPRSIMRQIGATDEDMRVLIRQKFVLLFDSGVIVIKHWRINNYLRQDRHKDTKYQEELAQLSVDENGSYHMEGNGIPTDNQVSTNCLPSDNQAVGKRYTQDRLVKERVGKERQGKSREENNSLSTTSVQKEEGGIRGEQPPPADPSCLSEKEPDDALHDSQVRYWFERLMIFRRQGFDTEGIYTMAEANGVTREDLDWYGEAQEMLGEEKGEDQ